MRAPERLSVPAIDLPTLAQVHQQVASRRRVTLCLVSLSAFLSPLATTIYLPVINVVKRDLGASSHEIVLTMSLFMVMYGIMPVIWGALSDWKGRRRILLIAGIIYSVFSIFCCLAWNVYVLIVCRMFQAIGAAAGLTVGAGTIADVYPPDQRGAAIGVFVVVPLVATLLGPVIGGIVGHGILSWRGVFLLLSFLCLGVVLLTYYFLDETLPRSQLECESSITKQLYQTAMLITNGSILNAASLSAVTYSGYYALLTVFPEMVERNFDYNSVEIGLAFIPFGVGVMLGSYTGGLTADWIEIETRRKEFRLVPACICSPAFALCLSLTAWSLYLPDVRLTFVLLFSFFTGMFYAIPRPGMSTFVIEKAKSIVGTEVASSVTGLMYSAMYGLSAISSQAAGMASGTIGVAWFLTIWGGVVLIFSAIMCAVAYFLVHRTSIARVPTTEPEELEPIELEIITEK